MCKPLHVRTRTHPVALAMMSLDRHFYFSENISFLKPRVSAGMYHIELCFRSEIRINIEESGRLYKGYWQLLVAGQGAAGWAEVSFCTP